MCALAMLGLSVRLFAAESGCTREALGRAQAVAHMRVTKLADELQENGVQHLATLTLCGAAGGLGETREVTVQLAADKDGHTDFSVPIGSRCVLHQDRAALHTSRALRIKRLRWPEQLHSRHRTR